MVELLRLRSVEDRSMLMLILILMLVLVLVLMLVLIERKRWVEENLKKRLMWRNESDCAEC